MIGINTNSGSLIVQSNLSKATLGLQQAIERMTTGFKINHAKDNAAGYSIVTNMTTKIGAYEVAENNALMGLDMLNTASESINIMQNITSRIRALAMQVQNGTYGSMSIDAINQEAVSLINELYREKNNTEYNGISLFGGKETQVEITFPDGTTQTSRGFLKEVQRRDTSTMTSVASLADNVSETGGTYSISTAEELEKASILLKNGNLKNAEFVLANNIDMKEWCAANSTQGGWQGMRTCKFDGNGYVIANLEMSEKSMSATIFGYGSTITNLGLENVNITSILDDVCAFGGGPIKLTNCYVTGSITGKNQVGGLVGNSKGAVITDCYVNAEINGSGSVGGLVGFIDPNGNCTIRNSFSAGNINATGSTGGLVGITTSSLEISNCASVAKINGKIVGAILGEATNGKLTIQNSYSAGTVGAGTTLAGLVGVNNAKDINIINGYYNKDSFKTENIVDGFGISSVDMYKMVAESSLPDFDLDLPLPNIYDDSFISLYSPAKVGFHIDIANNSADIISMNLSFTIDGLKDLCYLGLDSSKSLDTIDRMLESISSKASEFAVVQNRLESALEQISVQYENLVSSRSTIQDADIAEVSSEYIKMQILQNASATLLATANQTPEIALRLLGAGINT